MESTASRHRRQGSRRDPAIDDGGARHHPPAAGRARLRGDHHRPHRHHGRCQQAGRLPAVDLQGAPGARGGVPRPRPRGPAGRLHRRDHPAVPRRDPRCTATRPCARRFRACSSICAPTAAMRRVLSDRLEAAARGELAAQAGRRGRRGVPRPTSIADTLMDVIAGGAWYAVCVRRVKDTDRAAKELTDLVLHGVLSTCSRTSAS